MATARRDDEEDDEEVVDRSLRHCHASSLSDGVTFVHFGMYRDEAVLEKFTSTPSFHAFQAALKASKPVQPPAVEWLDLIGSSYDVF